MNGTPWSPAGIYYASQLYYSDAHNQNTDTILFEASEAFKKLAHTSDTTLLYPPFEHVF